MHVQLVLANPSDACTALTGNYTDKVVIFTEGSCSSVSGNNIDTAAQNVQNAGAVAGERTRHLQGVSLSNPVLKVIQRDVDLGHVY